MKHWWFFIFVFLVLTGNFPVNFVFAEEKIDINKASPEELVKIIHIGEARALELISLRPFSSLDDLTRIKGIGEKRVEDIKNQGMAWVEEPAFSPVPPAQKELAAAGESFEPIELGRDSKYSYVFPVAIFTSLLSGAIILILKKYVRT